MADSRMDLAKELIEEALDTASPEPVVKAILALNLSLLEINDGLTAIGNAVDRIASALVERNQSDGISD